MSETLSRQEMFNRAWNGLRSQGWKLANRAIEGIPDEPGNPMPNCMYLTPDGRRCAWGWVDTSLNEKDVGTVRGLYHYRRGIAGQLTYEDVNWALELQRTHDDASSSAAMVANLALFAQKYSLTIPSE